MTVSTDAAAPTPRRRGRPSGRAGEADQTIGPSALIDAVCELLRSTPPDKITRALVAQTAKVHPALINYHFTDNGSLLRAAARRLLEQFQQEVAGPIRMISDPAERLRKRIEGFLEFQLAYPFFHRLITEEILKGESEEAAAMLADMTRQGIASYGEILRDGHKEGIMEATDDVLFYLCVVGMVEQAAIGIPMLKSVDHPILRDGDYAARFARYMSDLLINGLLVQRSGE